MSDLLHAVGEALYGERWQAPLADAPGVNRCTVQRWAAGDGAPNAGHWREMLAPVEARIMCLQTVVGPLLSGHFYKYLFTDWKASGRIFTSTSPLEDFQEKMDMDHKILAKVSKLLALGTSTNPHEAAAALAKAQALLEAHNLTATDLELSQLTHTEVTSRFSSTKPRGFEILLATTVAQAFGCHALWRGLRGGFGSYVLIGPRARVPLAAHFLTVLTRKMRLGRQEFIRDLPRGRQTPEGDGWCWGYAQTVAAAVATVAGDQASREAARRYSELTFKMGPDIKAASRRVGSQGLRAGREAGQAERLYQPVNQGAQAPAKLAG